jgi:predicted DNA-binding ribbon-helix-helix protein
MKPGDPNRIKTVFPAGIPDELKELPVWVVWKKEIDEETGKTKKLPYQSKFPNRHAKNNDSITWGTYDQAIFALENESVDGIGMVVVSPYIILDFDHCIDENRYLDEDIEDTIDRVNTWGEVSQSRKGCHLIGKGTIDRDILKGLSRFFEIADGKKFLYLTGDLMGGTPNEIRDITDDLKALWYEKYKSRYVEKYGEIRKAIPKGIGQSEKSGTICDEFNLTVSDIGMPDDPVNRGPGIFQGGHPFHGSETGQNFSVDTQANVWYCFRHNVGGGPLELFAVREGIISCEQVGPGCLDDKWAVVFDQLERSGYHRKGTSQEKKIKSLSKSRSAWSVINSGSERTDEIAQNDEQTTNNPEVSLTRKPWSVGGQRWSVMDQWVVNEQDHVTILSEGALIKEMNDKITGDQRITSIIILMCFYWLKTKTDPGNTAITKAAEFNAKRCDPPLTTEELKAVVDQTFAALKPDVVEEPEEETVSPMDEKIHRWADNILRRGDTFKFFRNTFKTLHSGDIDVLETMLCAYAAQAGLCTMGIQVGLDGQKGVGKTTAIKAALHLHAPEYILEGSFSGKGLYYDEKLRDMCIIFSDDTRLEKDIASFIKRAMSNFQQGTTHLTVEKDKDGRNVAVRKTLPKRVMIIFTSVGDSGDSEILDRQYRLSVSPTVNENKKFINFVKDRMKSGREEYPTTRQVLVCNEITRILKSQLFKVEIPFTDRLNFSENDGRRDILIFFDFIKAVSIINHLKRNASKGEDDTIVITAEREDAIEANRIFKASEETRKYRLGKDQRSLIEWMIGHSDQDADTNKRRINEGDIIDQYGSKTGLSRSSIRRLLYGDDGKGGIVNKVPGIDVRKESVKYNERITQHNVISIDADLKSTLWSYTGFATIIDHADHH